MSRNNGIKERIVSGLAERGYTLGEMLSANVGPSGSVVFKGEYQGEPVALKLASYGLMDSFAGPNTEKLKDFRRREVETLRLAGNHPNIPSLRGYFDLEAEGYDPVYTLVMDYINHPSVADRTKKGERLSDKETRILLGDGLSAENHLHTGLPNPVIHRDVKTRNVLIGGDKAYLIDFDIVKQGLEESTRATQITPNGYYPGDFYTGLEESHRPEHDVVALGNVAIAGIAGKEIGLIRYEQGLYGLESVDTSSLNVSPELRKYLAKMISPEGKRFRTAREAIEGLERITGLPIEIKPRQEPEEQEVRKNYNMIEETIEEMELGKWGSRTSKIFGCGKAQIDLSEGRTPYQALKELWAGLGTYEEKSFLNRSAVQYLAKTHSTLQEALDGRSLEEMVGEKFKEKKPRLHHFRDTHTQRAGYFLVKAEREYESAKQIQRERRAQLLELVGINNIDLNRINSLGLFLGWIGGAIGGPASASILDLNIPLPWVLGSAALGAITGSYIHRRRKVNQFRNKVAEFDGWIREATKPKGNLERRVGDVDLGGEEKSLIFGKAVNYHFLSVMSPVVVGGISTMYSSFTPPDNFLPLLIGAATTVGIGIYEKKTNVSYLNALKQRLTNRALKKKRLAAGLPADGLAYEKTIELEDEAHRFKERLKKVGLKKKIARKRFESDDIKVEYKPRYEYSGGLNSHSLLVRSPDYLYTDVTVRARTPERRDEIVSILKPKEETSVERETLFWGD